MGAYDCTLAPDSLAQRVYNADKISERHRHRWEFNNVYKSDFEKAGLVLSGINPDKGLVEITEIKDHPFFIGVQFHPEKSGDTGLRILRAFCEM